MLLLKTLGGLQLVTSEAAPAGPATQRRRLALLALVAGHGNRGVTRDKLLGYLWPDGDPERARAALAQALYAIRKDVGGEFLVAGPAGELRLDRQLLDSDVCRFRDAVAAGRLEEAVGLYEGPFLDGFYLSDGGEFERWVDSERSALAHDYAAALERLATRDADRGDHLAAVGWWRRLAAADRLSARAAVGLMRALAAAGDRAGALQHARVYEALVRAELEAEPAGAVLALADELREHTGQHAVVVNKTTAAPEAALPPAVSADLPSHEPLPGSGNRPASPRLPLRPARLFTGGILLAAASVMAVLLVPPGQSATPIPALNAAAADLPVLAVGHFTEHGALADPAAPLPLEELLATSLARSPRLHVVSSARMHELLAGADTADPAGAAVAAARRAGADQLVDGTVFRLEDGTLRLDLRRTDLASGQVLGALTVEGGELFELMERGTEQLLAALGVAAPAGSVASVSTASVVAYRFYEEGIRAYYAGDGAAAAQLFHAALDEDSTFAMAQYYAALTATGRRDRLEHMRAALALARRASDRERLLIAGDWANLMEAPERLALAETLAVRYPTDPESHLRYASALVWSGRFPEALPHLGRVIALDSASFTGARPRCLACEATQMTAGVYRMLDSLERAEAVTRWWTERQPGSPGAWHEHSQILMALDRYDAALAAVQTAAALDPAGRHAIERALIHLRAGDFGRADSALLRDAASDDPQVRRTGQWWLITSLRMQGRLREALAVAREYRRGGEMPAGLRGAAPYEALAEGQVLLEAGRPAEALAVFDSVSRLAFPEDLPSRTARHRAWSLALASSAAYEAGELELLARLADTLRLLGPRSAYARDWRAHHHAAGLAALGAGQTQLAAAELRQAIFSPVVGYTRTNLYLAEALRRSGRAGEAVAMLQAALRGPLDGPNLYVTRTDLHEALARTFEAAGRADSAAAHWSAVADALRDADPELAGRRRYAEGRLRALGGAPAARGFVRR